MHESLLPQEDKSKGCFCLFGLVLSRSVNFVLRVKTFERSKLTIVSWELILKMRRVLMESRGLFLHRVFLRLSCLPAQRAIVLLPKQDNARHEPHHPFSSGSVLDFQGLAQIIFTLPLPSPKCERATKLDIERVIGVIKEKIVVNEWKVARYFG